MKITRRSSLSGVEHTLDIDITSEELTRILMRFCTNELIQDIVPNITRGEREFIKTGITQEEWDEAFSKLEN